VYRNQWTGPATLSEQFEEKVRRSEGCWEWAGSHMSTGYGNLNHGGRSLLAHRVSYELFVGSIPNGHQIDHLCRNRGCVNPVHLEAVSRRENILRGTSPAAAEARQTHCKRGHPFDEANTAYDTRGARRCRACHREKVRRQNAARRAR
jgi:hypothetical protein